MKSIPKFIAHHALRPLLERYLGKERTYRYGNLSIRVLPGVFHPGFFFSTKFLMKYLLQFPLEKKSLLELGAGSGLIAFVAETKGALITATDLSTVAIENLLLNKSILKSSCTVIHSDLFDKIPAQQFDFIVINPPYYSGQPGTDAALAWYCGVDFEYFKKLFLQLLQFIHSETKVLMVLSEDCDLAQIKNIALVNGFIMKETKRKKIWWEWNYIFEVNPR